MEISLCMIVKDEEETLARCLDSVKELVDEIVIVDTGSSDRTKEIARRYTEKIYDFVWTDDFSAARNDAFEKAGKAYCMWLDADDVLSPAAQEEFLTMKRELDDSVDLVMLPYHMAFDAAGRPAFTYYRERIVRNHPDYRFQGRVHEAILPHGRIVTGTAAVEHRKAKAGDTLRNLRIYQDMEKNGETFTARDLYYYGRELVFHGAYEQAEQTLLAFLEREDGWVKNKTDAARQLSLCCRALGRSRDALDALLLGLRYGVPDSGLCCDLGRAFLDDGRYREAAYWYEQALKAEPDRESGVFVEEECCGFLPAIMLCVCFDRLGDLKKAEEYNRLAGTYRPDSPHYLQNLEYFSSRDIISHTHI